MALKWLILSINGELTSIYEPIHGSAPDIAYKDLENTVGEIFFTDFAF